MVANDKGSVFTIILPLTEEHVECPPNSSDEKKSTQLKKNLRVMIVDDNKDAVRGLKSMLQKEKCHVNTAYTGKAALKKIKDFKPEALIIDIGLPDIKGYELIKAIKADYKKGQLYVALTGYSHKEAQAQSEKVGFDYHMNKPANFNELVEILSKVS